MANVTVALLRYVLVQGKGWRRVGVTPIAKGRGLQEELAVPREETVVQLGPYQLRWYENNRAKFEAVGTDLREAMSQRDAKQAKLEGRAKAEEAGLEVTDPNPDRPTLRQQADKFIRDKELANRDRETISAYKNLIGQFLTLTGRRYPGEITERDLLEFCHAQRKQGLSERTVMNYYGAITAFCNSVGVDHKKLVPKEHRPNKIDDDPIPYTRDQVWQFLAALDDERHQLFFEFLLKTGCREKEATHLEWTDIDWSNCCVNIPGEKNLSLNVRGAIKTIKFQTKTRRSRSIPLEGALLAKLQLWQRERPNTRFVFGTRADLPDGHYLEVCKETACTAKLNCGKCRSCLKTKGKECEDWYLHRWRHTFATWALQSGKVDLKTLQRLLGHTDISMTSRYLGVAGMKTAQSALNEVFAEF